MDRFDSVTCQTLRRSLKRWFDAHARPLPWRATADPYRIWISEIMLQQTTVKAVVPYYERFLARFPTVHDLADASEAEVLQYWEGLGYYSRGRNLRLAAQVIRERYDGRFPSDLASLMALPGVGRYTAGAIRSFAFDLPAPIVEANTLRLYCRLLGFDGDPRSRAGQELLWNFAERLQPRRNAGPVNQALMELGATLCTPTEPRCPECPLRRHCAAFAECRQHAIPRPKERREMTHVVEATVAVQAQGRYLVRQRKANERWAGMWDFPRFPIASVGPREQLERRALARLASEVREQIETSRGLTITTPSLVTEIRHSVTRYRIRLLCLLATANPSLSDTSEQRWLTPVQLEKLPMPVTGRRFTTLLADTPPLQV